MADENSVLIQLNGDANGLRMALESAQSALKMLGTALTETAAQTNDMNTAGSDMSATWTRLVQTLSPLLSSLSGLRDQMASLAGSEEDSTSALQQQINAMNRQREELLTLRDAQTLYTASTVEQYTAWLQAADGATEYAARLDWLQAQIQLTKAENGPSGGGFNIFGGLSSFMSGGFSGLASAAGVAEGPLGLLATGLDSVTGAIGGFISQSATMITSLLGWQAFNDVAGYVSNFAQEMFNLNNTVQKNEYTWKYLFGGGAKGMYVSQHLMDWTKTASLTMPYTRQDMLGAITTMLTLPGMNAAKIEKYLPMLSDLGASRNPDLSLSGVAMAIMGAQFGLTRQLRYELRINPEELVKYGLKGTTRGGTVHITDPNSLLPALMNFAKAHGYLGAGKDIAQNTWWGAWSSWVDRIQNFQLSAGSSMFSHMQKYLVGISDWWDSHKKDMNEFADIIGRLAGDAVQAGGGLLGGMFTEIAKLGGPEGLAGILNGVSTWIETVGGFHVASTSWTGDGAHLGSGWVAGGARVYAAGGGAKHHTLSTERKGGHGRASTTVHAPHAAGHQSQGGFAAFGAGIVAFGGKIGDFFSKLGGWMHDIFNPFLQAVGPGASAAFKELGDSLGPMLTAMEPWWNLLKDLLGTLGGIVGLLVGDALAGAAATLSFVFNSVTDALQLMNPLINALDGLFKAINPHFKEAGQLVGQLSDTLTNIVNNLVPKIPADWLKKIGWTTPNYNTAGPTGYGLVPTSVPHAGGNHYTIHINIHGNGDAHIAKVTHQTVTNVLNQQSVTSRTPGSYAQFGALGR